EIGAGSDLVADGRDNFATRYLLTEICFRLNKPLIAAALSPFEGQLSSFRPYLGEGHPCYRCLFREPPPPDLVPRCEEAGILGAVAGVMGTLQAVEVLKELLGLGDSLDGTERPSFAAPNDGDTGLPVPRFVSLHADRVNLRTGPGDRYPIEWVLTRKEMPVEITGQLEHWRRIRDWEGTAGWVHERMLT